MHSDTHSGAIKRAPWCAALMGFGLFVFHLLVNRQYGFHGDELYFIVCGQRPAWGYVDHPPLVPMAAWLATELMGVNLFALRFFPALVLGASCFLTGWLARRLGAGRYGEFLASLTFVCTPILLRLGAILNIPCFEVFFWLVAAHLLVSTCKYEQPRWWLAIGALCGVALLAKHTTLFLGTGLAVGLVLTQRRKDLLTPWPWAGALLAFAIFLPNLLWQYHHDWATLEFVRNLNASEMQQTGRVEFIAAQFILMNLFGAFVWVSGLFYFLKSVSGRPYRMLGWVFVTVFVILLAFKAKVYYLVPAYPMLMAGGAVLLERSLTRPRLRWMRVALPVAIVAMSLVLVPLMTPLGSLEWKERYISSVLGFMAGDPSDLTFDFRYQMSRQEQLEVLRQVYDDLSEKDRQGCVILTDEYDTASMVNVLGRDPGLPQAISGNNSYFLWGPRGATGECVIVFGYDEDLMRSCFRDVSVAALAPCPWYKKFEKGRPVYLCRDPLAPFEELWPRFKRYR
ncbi:MAG: glycosyltransferase family 39 protein [Candidatus Hydrogenedentes bacterium]|nr:glycosyltransferase family 39 protein [Candidatus Hydrogenedentota bacterium]